MQDNIYIDIHIVQQSVTLEQLPGVSEVQTKTITTL